jgi:hypothetical protein
MCEYYKHTILLKMTKYNLACTFDRYYKSSIQIFKNNINNFCIQISNKFGLNCNY